MNKKPDILDKRLVDRFVSRGIVKRSEVEKSLKSLPDLEGSFEDIADKVYPAERAEAVAESEG